MPASAVRALGGLLLLLGLVMFLNVVLGWGFGDGLFNVLRLFHLLAALGFVGLVEMTMARNKGKVVVRGQPLKLPARILLTLTLVVGLYLLLSHFIEGLGGYNAVIWIHALMGLVAYGLTEMVLTRFRVS